MDFSVREGGGLAILGCPKGWVGGLIFHFLRGVGADLFWNDPFAKDEKCQNKIQALWNCTYGTTVYTVNFKYHCQNGY